MTPRSKSCTSMDRRTFEQRYLRINKLVGVLSGLWPGQSKISKTLTSIVTYTIGIGSFVVQVAHVIRDYSFDRLIAQIPYLCLALIVVGKHVNYTLYGTKVKELLNIIVKDWEVQRSKEELAILECYSNRAALLSMIYTVCIFSSSFMFSIQPAVPHVLDVLIPLNESRGRILVYPAYFFMDEDKYYYFIIINEMMGSLEIFLVFSTCDMFLVWFIQHASCKLALNWQASYSILSTTSKKQCLRCVPAIKKTNI
ncbi:uncharacterized protein LOC128896664 [Hylaeus anthracinus]|uniref:uncharacterized protein LOC128896664 n=1 Tax=Hylaeus anthracinus TaxID=313031 RepID=UPI0023B95B99|nr:uncharacterized protein LOC128896664 [Hylaeus anthracinus]